MQRCLVVVISVFLVQSAYVLGMEFNAQDARVYERSSSVCGSPYRLLPFGNAVAGLAGHSEVGQFHACDGVDCTAHTLRIWISKTMDAVNQRRWWLTAKAAAVPRILSFGQLLQPGFTAIAQKLAGALANYSHPPLLPSSAETTHPA